MQMLKTPITQEKLDALLNDAKAIHDQNPRVNFSMNLNYAELRLFLTRMTVVTPDPMLCVHCNSKYATKVLLTECEECLGLVCTFCRTEFCQTMTGETSVKTVLCHHCEKRRKRDETRPCSECSQPLCEYCSERYYKLGLLI